MKSNTPLKFQSNMGMSLFTKCKRNNFYNFQLLERNFYHSGPQSLVTRDPFGGRQFSTDRSKGGFRMTQAQAGFEPL